MADWAAIATAPARPRDESTPGRHSVAVRVSHWLTVVAFLALLVTGIEILLSHPRFYWGETGNINMQPLFKIPVPSSRDMVPTGYGYVLPDQNGWSRYLHFQSAWLLVLVGFFYLAWGFLSGHFRRNMIPARADLSGRAMWSVIARHLRLASGNNDDAQSYNVLQRLSYLVVVFILFPLIIWTGLAMSPAFVSAVPATVNLLGGHQSARTIHFFVTILLTLFLFVHVIMVCLSGFGSRMRAMITGRAPAHKELA